MEANYTYDVWGNILDATGSMADINPLRYRGYYYYTETGWYYLQSRYYDPVIHRFINADGYASTGQGFLGCNMFAYCVNNPVNYSDQSGCRPKWEHNYGNGLIGYTDSATGVPEWKKTPNGNYYDFLDALGYRESTNNYGVENEYGYLGRYQMGDLALQEAGFKDSSNQWTDLAKSYGVDSKESYLASPAAQDAAVKACHVKICGYIRNYDLTDYLGTNYCGVTVTLSGLLGAAHLVGVDQLSNALKYDTIAQDAYNTTAAEYLELFSGYDISVVWIGN